MHADIVGVFQVETVSFVQHNLISEFVNRTIPFDFFHSDDQFVHTKSALQISHGFSGGFKYGLHNGKFYFLSGFPAVSVVKPPFGKAVASVNDLFRFLLRKERRHFGVKLPLIFFLRSIYPAFSVEKQYDL